MRKRIIYLFAFVLTMGLYASSKGYINTEKCKVACKKQIKALPKEDKTVSEEGGLMELSPAAHFLVFQI
jgi:hypothetical protein